jgi:uncharacterized protein with PQ loop repeat
MNDLEIIGWLGSILLAFCGLPQAIMSIRNKSSYGIAWGSLLMWLFGEIFTIIYIFPQMQYPLLFNYFANIVFLGIIIYYKLFPKT